MNRIIFGIRLVLGVIVGLFISIIYIQCDENIKHYCAYYIKHEFEKTFQCHYVGGIETCDIIGSRIVLRDILVKDRSEQWSWQAKKVVVNWSWPALLLNNNIVLTIQLDKLQAHSNGDTHHSVHIIDHIYNLMDSKSDSHIVVSELEIKKGEFNLHNAMHEIDFKTNFDSHLGIFPDNVTLHAYLSEGSLQFKNHQFVQNLGLTMNVSRRDSFHHIGTKGTFDFCVGEQKNSCHVNGFWKDTHGLCKIQDTHGLFAITADLTKKIGNVFEIKTHVTTPLETFKPLQLHEKIDDCNGDCLITAHAEVGNNDFKWQAHCCIENMKFKNISLGTLLVDGENVQTKITGGARWFMHNSMDPLLQALWNFDTDSSVFSLQASNSSLIEQAGGAGWQIAPSHGTASIIYNNGNKELQAHLQLQAQHNALGISPKILVNLMNQKNDFSFEGLFNDYTYHGSGRYDTEWIFNQLTIQHHDKSLLHLLGSSDHSFKGFIDYQLLEDMAASVLKKELIGQGTMHVNGAFKGNQLKAKVSTDELTIRLGRMYNFIRSAQSEVCVDVANAMISFSNTQIKLDKGSLRSEHAVLYCNETGIYYAHIPCIVHKLLLNHDKDFFVVGSGALTFIKQHEQPTLKGTIIVDRALIKKNILSAAVQQNIYGPKVKNDNDMLIDIALLSKNPVRIKTSFLETDAALDLQVQNTIDDPGISGAITLRNGHLAFPYKPLNIMHGKIYFLPHQYYDPLIELVAKNHLRRYQITMHVDGSLQQPHISFESAPPLTEEQIITLLLAGNADGALSLAMPSLVMNNIKNVMFGQEQSESIVQRYFNQLLLPLPNIRLVPGFSDQHGRGGLRGSIEIDVNDQLHAMIQKNFSLPEDTRIEVEYNISDDMSIRGMKDERGDLGAEMEVRFKF